MARALFIGSDHAGYELKQSLMHHLSKQYFIQDQGCFSKDSVDYPDYAHKVAELVAETPDAVGILICGSGIGMSIVANKVRGVRAACCESLKTAVLSRQHNNANIICLGERIISETLALEMVKAWLTTSFEGGRHEKRIKKIQELE